MILRGIEFPTRLPGFPSGFKLLTKTLLLIAEEMNLLLMTALSIFRTLAQYNRIANQRLYAACAQIAVEEDYRRQRAGSFGSIHALLNHNLLADRIWMSRFSGGGKTTPPLNTVLYDQFQELRMAREQEDVRMEEFFQNVPTSFLANILSYTNSKGQACEEAAVPAVL